MLAVLQPPQSSSNNIYITIQQLFLSGVGVQPTCSVSTISSGDVSPLHTSRTQYVAPGLRGVATASVLPDPDTDVFFMC